MTGNSSGSILSPHQAAIIAQGIYITDHSGVKLSRIIHGMGAAASDNFDLEHSNQFSAQSGFTLAQTISGFGLVAMGKKNKFAAGQDFSNDALVAIRGTDLTVDWVSDAHAGHAYIHGKLVHSGFYKIYKSLLPTISAFFHRNKPRRVHVVGHSMGGAVAVLVANWIQENTGSEPVLYTFGAPRAGGDAFAKHFTVKIKPKNIYRVYHANDPVPMVPVWPFYHAPDPGRSYCLHYGGWDIPINPNAHKIAHYIASVKKYSTWHAMSLQVHRKPSDKAIKDWLWSHKVYPAAIWASELYYWQHGVDYVLRKCGKAVAIGLQLRISADSDFLDDIERNKTKIINAMVQAGKASLEIAEMVEKLVMKMLRIAGITYIKTIELNYDFLMWVFTQLKKAIYKLAQLAIKSAPVLALAPAI